MRKSIGAAVFVSALIVAGAVTAQSMLVDAAADKVITKYQTANCDDLKAQKAEPPSEKENIALDLLRDDPKSRVAFFNKIAAACAEQDVRLRNDPMNTSWSCDHHRSPAG